MRRVRFVPGTSLQANDQPKAHVARQPTGMQASGAAGAPQVAHKHTQIFKLPLPRWLVALAALSPQAPAGADYFAFS